MTDRDLNVIVETSEGNLGFRFSTWVIKQTQIRCGCKGIISIFQKLGVDDGDTDADTLSVLVEEAHNEFLKFTKSTEPKITNERACGMIDEMGGPVLGFKKIAEGLTMHVPKNPEPPQPVGEKILQSTT